MSNREWERIWKHQINVFETYLHFDICLAIFSFNRVVSRQGQSDSALRCMERKLLLRIANFRCQWIVPRLRILENK